MKILWFTWKDLKNPRAGGAEVVNEELAKRLVAEGHEVTFIVANFKGKIQDSVDRTKMEGLDRITLFPTAKLSKMRGKDYEIIKGYRVIRVGNRWTVYNEARKYYKKHLADWPDMIIDEVNTVPFFAKFYAKQPVHLFIHQLARKVWFYQMPKPLAWVGYILEPLYHRLLNNLKVITVSESTKQDLIRHGYKPENIHIISEGITMTPLAELNPKPLTLNPTLLSLGSVRPMKRTLDQIKAFEIAKRRVHNLKLVIAGELEGNYGKKVLAYIRKSPFENDIEVTGKINNQKKATLLQKAYLTLSTSVKEGWGLTITEANSQGTPAVVYNVDGLRDAVLHNQTGLVSDESPQSMAQSIVALLKDSKRYNKLRQAAHKFSKTITFNRSHEDFKKGLEI